MSDCVHVGIIGLGHNGVAHLKCHLESDLSRVVAVCDRNPELVKAVCAEFGIARGYTDERFFDDAEMEAISINTGDQYHAEPFELAVRSGRHVLIEKPLANSEEDVLRMVEAFRDCGSSLKIQVGYILRFNPVFEAVHELAASGQLGDVYYLEGDYIHNLLSQAEKPDPVTGVNWYLEHEMPIVGGGSHPLDLLRWFSGKEVVEVSGFSNGRAFPQMRYDDCQVALFRFEDGTVAKVAALYAPRLGMAPFYNLRVYGTRGTVERDTVALSSSEEDVHPELQPVEADRVGGHPYTNEIDDWLRGILEDKPVRVPFLDGANSTMATLCAVRAMQEGKSVAVPVFR
ncbi:MAG: Gfo/Idh/MocA family oxidoreductase [Lentisphaeria bacterium]|nr:Gfo/Idh/MocA family oxidoreductase [Lentisphaeria bacterium]